MIFLIWFCTFQIIVIILRNIIKFGPCINIWFIHSVEGFVLKNLIYCNTWKILLTIRGSIAMIYIFSFFL